MHSKSCKTILILKVYCSSSSINEHRLRNIQNQNESPLNAELSFIQSNQIAKIGLGLKPDSKNRQFYDNNIILKHSVQENLSLLITTKSELATYSAN